jgi:hypothetical protein
MADVDEHRRECHRDVRQECAGGMRTAPDNVVCAICIVVFRCVAGPAHPIPPALPNLVVSFSFPIRLTQPDTTTPLCRSTTHIAHTATAQHETRSAT